MHDLKLELLLALISGVKIPTLVQFLRFQGSIEFLLEKGLKSLTGFKGPSRFYKKIILIARFWKHAIQTAA